MPPATDPTELFHVEGTSAALQAPSFAALVRRSLSLRLRQDQA